jgi:hypothetical protein
VQHVRVNLSARSSAATPLITSSTRRPRGQFRRRQLLVELCLPAFGLLLAVRAAAASEPGLSGRDGLGHASYDLNALPIRFEPNVSQAPSRYRYIARGKGYLIALAESGVTLCMRDERAAPGLGSHGVASLRISLANAQATMTLSPERPLRSVSNYFIGDDPTRWRRGVANYGAVRYREVYSGVDWVLYGNPRDLEYDFIVAPHADPQQIRLQIDG